MMVPVSAMNYKAVFVRLVLGFGDNNLIFRLVLVLCVMPMSGCIFMPGGSVVDSALVVHTAGSSQSTIAARIPVEAPRVYAAFTRILDERPDIETVSRKDSAHMIEVKGDFGKITAQVTILGARESLLYVWADTKGSGRTGSDVAGNVIEIVCGELGVEYERVEY
jgi:hypothetical protein